MQPLGEGTDLDRQNALYAQGIQSDYARLDEPALPTTRLIRRWMRNWGIAQCIEAILRRKLRTLALAGCASSLILLSFADDNQVGRTLASVSYSAGFSVSKLLVEGNSSLGELDVKAELSDFLGSSMINLDVSAARDVISENPWVKTANVKKVYPDTLVVELVERRPVALWKSENDIVLISADGVAIDRAQAQHMHLPQVVGDGANRVASEFLTTINLFPDLIARADAYVRVANRRWDLVLDDGIRVLLPAEGWREALLDLDKMQETQKILDRELLQIDMRLSDRLVFRLESGSAQTRRDHIERTIKQGKQKT